MPCERRLKPKQTLAQRAQEVRKARSAIDKLLATKKVSVKVDRRTGAIVFIGIPEETRDGVSDGCVLRHIMTSGSVGARQAIAQAERLAGRSVDRKVVAQGLHSHDNGATFGRH